MEYNKLLHVLHICGLLTTVWPLHSKAGKFKTFSYNVLWFIYTLNMISLCYLMVKSLIVNREDFINTMKTLVELIYTMEIIFNLFYCRMQRKRLQVNIPNNLILLVYFSFNKTQLEIK